MAGNEPVSDRYRQTHRKIYQHIYNSNDFCTRQSLARDLNLSLPTIYQHLTELMDAGLVGFSGEQRYTGGRNANGLAVIPDARIAVGIAVTDNRVRFAAADLRLGELAYRKLPYELKPTLTGTGVFLARELERFLDDEGLDRSRLLGVGIALPGIISPDGTRLALAPTLGLRDVPLHDLTSAIPYPTHLENDANSGGFAEWFLRRGQQNMAYLSLENGVGGAVLTGGTGYLGDSHRSGEFGHMCVEPGGLPCTCGKQGCLESYCSPRRISDDLGLTLEEFFTRVEQHDMAYETLWHDLLRHLAIGINNIRMALDCDVVLGGLLSEYLPPYFPLLKQYVAASSIFDDGADYLQLSRLRRHNVSLGAALHFIQKFFRGI